MKKLISKIKVSVIIPTFNRLKYLYPCLLCLFNQKTDFFWEIVVIDSGNDTTEDLIRNLKFVYGDYLKYKKIKNTKNRSKLRNMGANLAKGELLIFLDNDILVDKDFVQNHYEIYKLNSNSIILGKRKLLTEFLPEKYINKIVLNHYNEINNLAWIIDSRDVFLGKEKNTFDNNLNQWRFLYSHNFSISKNIFKSLKGFNEVFGNKWGYEDIDLGFRYSIELPDNRFILSDKLTGFHLPHINQVRQSITEGYENLEIFHNIHNCFEIELNVAFCLEFDVYYDKLLKIKKNDLYDKHHIFDNSDNLTFGYLWTKDDKKTLENNKYFGICLPFIKDNSFENIQIIDSFFLFPDEIKNSLLREAFRISRNSIYLEYNTVTDSFDVIEQISENCGYEVEIQKEKEFYKVIKINTKRSKFFCIYLPDCTESKKRFYYEILALFLKKTGFFVKLVDTKFKENINDENYLLSEFELNQLNSLFLKEYGAVNFQSIVPFENLESLSRIITNNNKILIYDSAFCEQLKNSLLIKKDPKLNFSFLEAVVIDYILKNFKDFDLTNEEERKNNHKNISVLISADDGFIEDNLEEILKTFKNLSNYKLIIKLPDYKKLSLSKYVQHNSVSKKNQSFSIMLKHRLDELQIINLIQKYKMNGRVKLVKANYSISNYLKLINSTDIFMDISKGVIPSPLVYFSFFSGKKVVLGKHINVCEHIKRYCMCIDSKQTKIIEKFSLPTNIENQFTSCFTCNSKDIQKTFLNINIIGAYPHGKNKISNDFRESINQMLSSLIGKLYSAE